MRTLQSNYKFLERSQKGAGIRLPQKAQGSSRSQHLLWGLVLLWLVMSYLPASSQKGLPSGDSCLLLLFSPSLSVCLSLLQHICFRDDVFKCLTHVEMLPPVHMANGDVGLSLQEQKNRHASEWTPGGVWEAKRNKKSWGEELENVSAQFNCPVSCSSQSNPGIVSNSHCDLSSKTLSVLENRFRTEVSLSLLVFPPWYQVAMYAHVHIAIPRTLFLSSLGSMFSVRLNVHDSSLQVHAHDFVAMLQSLRRPGQTPRQTVGFIAIQYKEAFRWGGNGRPQLKMISFLLFPSNILSWVQFMFYP